ncbi:MAG: hydantoinase B/oxoprolinase family protein [Rhizobiales bacterium]|nr:hydantoinase B/oxoprolinase family protein [Hyphomicrobiales bacterium]
MRESLVAVVKEMRANIIHSSYSSIIYEGHDFSCALVSADGRLLAQSLDDNPLHIFAVPHSAREIVRVFGNDIHEGDVFLHNDPYTGGTHLNDVLMLYPVFSAGRLVLFAAARCHWGDVGGSTPGSLSGRVTEILQEGIRIVPTRICEKGKLNEPFLQLLFQNMRNPAEREGDFKTMLGTSRKAAEHVKRLIVRFGVEKTA